MSKLLLIVAAAVATAIPAGWSARERAAARHITAAGIAGHIRFLADDVTEGRAPGSRGSEIAMRYVAAEMERFGLQPAGDGGSWQQRFDLVGMTSNVVTPMTFKADKGGATLVMKNVAEAIVAPGLQREAMSVSDAEVVFVGYGISAPEQHWDDWKGTDVRGKVVVVMNNDPENDPTLFAGKTRLYYGRWDYKYAEAARHGAAGVIIIHTEHSAGYPWQVVQSSWSGEDFELPAGDEPRVTLRMWAREDMAQKLAKLGGFDLDELRARAEKRDFKPVPLNVKMSAALKLKVERIHSANVLGMIPGSDGKLKDQMVVVTAHHDHLGMREGKGDTIYNGALDNASGVAAMLEMAEAIARTEAKPKRTILFAAVGGEESGLLGSEYFSQHPIVPAGRIAANINIDGINIWGHTTDISFIGFGKSDLDQVLVAAAKTQGRTVTGDPMPEKGSFYRSDQFSFAKIGVPGLYLEAGVLHPGHDAAWGREVIEEYTKVRYHQPSDQLDETWKLDGAVEDVQLMTTCALRIADGANMPAWKAGDEFEAARKRAVGAAER
jgi:Zn-dependent M28 family amino/carboxypeptidase